MSHGVNKSCITQRVVAQGGYASEVVRYSQNTAWRCNKKHCMPAAGGLETWTWWPNLANSRLDVLIVLFTGSYSFSRIWSERERERERGGGGIEQNLPLAWTSLSVACPTICMQRRDKWDSNVSWGASQRRVTKRTVAYQAAVSIRLSQSLDFPTCLFLASPLSWPHQRWPMASRKEQLSSLFFVAWSAQPLHEKLSMGLEGPSSLKETQTVKKIFLLTIDSGVTTRGPWYFLLASKNALQLLNHTFLFSASSFLLKFPFTIFFW